MQSDGGFEPCASPQKQGARVWVIPWVSNIFWRNLKLRAKAGSRTPPPCTNTIVFVISHYFRNPCRNRAASHKRAGKTRRKFTQNANLPFLSASIHKSFGC